MAYACTAQQSSPQVHVLLSTCDGVSVTEELNSTFVFNFYQLNMKNGSSTKQSSIIQH